METVSSRAPARRLEDAANAQELVHQFAAQILDPFLAFEMHENAVAKKEARRLARHRQAKARQIMQLPESAGEGGLPALVGTGNHDHPLRAVDTEIVEDRSLALCRELLRERQIEHIVAVERVFLPCQARMAERQADTPERPDIAQTAEIKLDLAIKPFNHGIAEFLVILAERMLLAEDIREQLGHALEDLRLYVVHAGEFGEF